GCRSTARPTRSVADPSGPLRRRTPQGVRRRLVGDVAFSAVQVLLPVLRYGAVRAGGRLSGRVALRVRQDRPVVRLRVAAGPEPVLTRLEARDERVTCLLPVRRRVLRGARVAAPDVPALSAPPQVEPPPTGLQALHASRTRRRDGPVHSLAAHLPSLP